MPNLLARLRTRGPSDSAVAHAISGSVGATSGAYGSAFSTYGGGWDVDRSVQEGLERVSAVFRCVDAIATNQSKLRMVVREGGRKKGKVVKDDDIDFVLNERANSYETSQAFRYRLSAQLLLSKRGAFVEWKRTESGRLQLHLLPAQNVEPVPDPRTFVAGYRLMTADQGEVWLEKENIIWIRIKPHPVDPYLQLTPLTAAGLAIETDFLSRMFNRNFLLNDGKPGLLIGVSGQLNQTDAKELKDRFSGGVHQAGRTSVVESDGITVNDLSATPHDMQWLEAIRGSQDDILLAFGTPMSVLGDASGRTFDNADAEKENWWEETMMGHCDPIGAAFDPLTGNVYDGKTIGFDYDEVDVLQRRKRAREDKSREEFAGGTKTLDEVFEDTGREKWDIPGTRVLFLPNGVIVGRTDEDTKAASELPAVAVQQQADIAKEAQRGAQMGTAAGQRSFENIIAARAGQLATGRGQRELTNGATRNDFALAAGSKHDVVDAEIIEVKEHPYEDFADVATSLFERDLSEFSDHMTEIVTGRLDHPKVRRGTRHWEIKDGEYQPAVKALNPGRVVQAQRLADDMEKALTPTMRRIANRAMTDAAKDMVGSGITRVMHARGLGSSQGRSDLMKVYGTRADANDLVTDVLTPIVETIRASAVNHAGRVSDRIREMDANGSSLSEIKSEVRKMTGKQSRWRNGLAQAMTTAITESARYETYARAGDIVNKIWNTVDDDSVRATHRAVDQEERPIDRDFKVGKYRMAHPGDSRAGIEEKAGCRCYNDYVISPEAEAEYDELAYGDDIE